MTQQQTAKPMGIDAERLAGILIFPDSNEIGTEAAVLDHADQDQRQAEVAARLKIHRRYVAYAVHRSNDDREERSQEDEEDRRSVIDGIRMSMDMMQQRPLQAITRKPHLVPASTSDADIWTHVKKTCHTTYHPTTTCAIGN